MVPHMKNIYCVDGMQIYTFLSKIIILRKIQLKVNGKIPIIS